MVRRGLSSLFLRAAVHPRTAPSVSVVPQELAMFHIRLSVLSPGRPGPVLGPVTTRFRSSAPTLGPLLGVLRPLTVLLALTVSGACAGSSGAGSEGAPPDPGSTTDGGPRVVQPGAPGAPTTEFEGSSLEAVEGVAYTEADVAFMQGMIHHHAQALEMTALIEDRTDTRAIHQMGLRMRISQTDEIARMERWLGARGEAIPEWRHVMDGQGMDHGSMDHQAMDHGAMHPSGADGLMPGMLTAEQ